MTVTQSSDDSSPTDLRDAAQQGISPGAQALVSTIQTLTQPAPTSSVAQAFAQRGLAASRIIIHAIWSANFATTLELLHANICFATTQSNGYSYGRQQALRVMTQSSVGRAAPSTYEIRSELYNVLPLGPDSCVATAQYAVHVAGGQASGGRGLAAGGRPWREVISTMVWVRANNPQGLALLLCHNSTVTSDTTRAAGDLRRIALRAHDSAGSTHWVLPSEVVFVKAARQYTEVHCVDRILRLRGSFAGMVEQLDGVVVKIHRSFAVNPLFVSRMEGEMLYLQTGDKLPVPARHIAQVRKLLGAE